MKLYLLIFFISLNIKGVCCLSASQYRLFPICKTDNGILVNEIHLFRNDGKDFKPAWVGVAFLKEYNQEMRELSSIISDTIEKFTDSLYEQKISQSYLVSMELAKKRFHILQTVSLKNFYRCDFLENCFIYNLKYDSLQREVFLQENDKRIYKLNCLKDSSSIASELYYKAKNYGDPDLFDFYDHNLYISSIRTFDLLGKELVVIHIANGQKFEELDGGYYPPGEEIFNEELDVSLIKKMTFREQVIHHGIGFDFLFLKEKAR